MAARVMGAKGVVGRGLGVGAWAAGKVVTVGARVMAVVAPGMVVVVVDWVERVAVGLGKAAGVGEGAMVG